MIQDSDDPKLDQARRHLSIITRGLVLRFDADMAAATLAGALVGLMEQEHGRERAVLWLRTLADELEHDDGPAWHGHA